MRVHYWCLVGAFSSAMLWSGGLAAQTRLSQWLHTHDSQQGEYPLGLLWITPEERQRQVDEFNSLKSTLTHMIAQKPGGSDNFFAMLQALGAMPPTGRVRLNAANAYWLEANPKRDPVVRESDEVMLPMRPTVVRVMISSGAVCDVPHKEGMQAQAYVEACFADRDAGAWAWQVQPDGRVHKVGIALWSRSLQDQPAPGAWLWVPMSGSEISDAFNLRWANWLATQGVADRVQLDKFADFHRQTKPLQEQPSFFDLAGKARRDSLPSTNNWGNVGLLQTPTARMRNAGYFGLGFHRAWPYGQFQIFMQPFDWAETGFRYVDIANRMYGPEWLSGDQTYKDKSIDLKLRAIEESSYLPAISFGWRDMGGTGLFSSEYVVASKRTGRLDWSAGLGWGYLSGFTRAKDVGLGGKFASSSWFRGERAPFAGVSYESPWNLVFKVEYEGNRYQNEPLGNVLKVKRPINLGVVYRPWRGLDVSAGVERGDTWSFGLTFYTDFSTLNAPKLMDPSIPIVTVARPSVEPRWDQTVNDLERLTDWNVEKIYRVNETVVVQASKTQNPYPQVRLDKAMAVLHRDAPQDVKTVAVHHSNLGGVLAVEQVDRQNWVQSQTEPARMLEQRQSATPTYPEVGMAISEAGEAKATPQELWQSTKSANYYLEPGLDFVHTLGGPDGFLLYQFSAATRAGLKMPGNWELKSEVRAKLLNNYDRFKYTAPSNLPRVRTYMKEYFVTSPFTITNLTINKAGRVNQNVYWAAYGGYFEEMFGGVGAEILYRQAGSRWALGVDVNQLRQRAFEQNFNFRDYKVNTGHVTGYWSTPIEGVHTSLSLGQYLAGDRGATFSISKVFSNGSLMGAFVTKTNVPAEVFGEGSFDKGVFWSIPFDAFLLSSSRSYANFGWRPLTRDGGAKVTRPLSLFHETGLVGPMFNSYLPSTPANDLVAPDDRRDK